MAGLIAGDGPGREGIISAGSGRIIAGEVAWAAGSSGRVGVVACRREVSQVVRPCLAEQDGFWCVMRARWQAMMTTVTGSRRPAWCFRRSRRNAQRPNRVVWCLERRCGRGQHRWGAVGGEENTAPKMT